MRNRDRGRRRKLRRRQAAELAARAGRPEEETTIGRTAASATPGWAVPPKEMPFELTDDNQGQISGSAGAEATAGSVDSEELMREMTTGFEPATERREPGAEELLDRAASEALERGEPGRSVGIYSELLKLNPRNVKARNNMALLLDQAGDHEGALEAMDQCLVDEPTNVQVLINRGAILGSLARYMEAERDLREAVRLDPANAEGHFNLGIVSVRRGLWAEAAPYLRRAVELDSSRAAAYFYLGEALNHVDDLQGALQSYQRATELQPTKAEYLCGLGIILDRLNRPDDAAQMYRRSREMAGR